MKNIIKNNLFLKLLALLFAVIIWVMVININDPTETKMIDNIKITTVNGDILQGKDKSFTLGNNGAINVQVMGRKTIISELTADDFIAKADMSKLSITNTVEVTVKTKKNLDILILNDVRLINVTIDNVVETPFPITIKSEGNPIEGMAVGALTSEPEQVTIRGSESMIRKIKEIVGKIDVSNARKDIEADTDLTIYDYEGNVIKSESVSMRFDKVKAKAKIYRIKTVPIVITNVPDPESGYATGDVLVNPSSVNITGPSEVLSKINNLSIPFDENKFGKIGKDNLTTSFDIKDFIPEGTTLVGDNSNISIKIVVDKRYEKEVKISGIDIVVRNKETGMNYNIQDIKFNIYGTKSILEKITKASDLQPEIDVKNLQEGSSNVELVLKPLVGIKYDKQYINVEVTRSGE